MLDSTAIGNRIKEKQENIIINKKKLLKKQGFLKVQSVIILAEIEFLIQKLF